jgi:integrase
MALNTGCRKQEILSLKWEQVDLKNNIILLEKTKNGKRRDVPINETVREVLTSQKKWLDVPIVYLNPETKKREVFTPRTRWPDVPNVFFNPNIGKPYGEVKNSFASALKRAGILDFTFHDLRHTFASHLVMNGVDITSIKELLGHSTLKMTLRYAHLASAHKARAVSVLDGVFSAQQKPTAQKLHSVG